HVRQRNRLHDADAAGLADSRDELRIAARIHRAADQRDLDPGLLQEGRLGAPAHAAAPAGADDGFLSCTGPSFQRTVARAIRSPFWSVISEVKSYSPSTVRSGNTGRLSAV